MNTVNESFWQQTANYKNLNTKNISEKRFDVLIIGAGLTGINTAYMLTNKGLSVAVIDAAKLGYGVSGYTTAKITIQHGLLYDYLIRNFGLNSAENYYKANLDGLNFYKDLIYSMNIPCDMQKDKSILYSIYDDKIFEFRTEHDAYKKIGIKSSLCDIYSLDFPIKCGLEIDNQYKFNPLKYLYYMAEYIERNGIDIYENVRVKKIHYIKKPYTVVTDKGNVYADKIVIASHFPLNKTLGMFFLKQYQEKSYVIACKTSVKSFEGMYRGIDKNSYSIRFQKSGKDNILLLGGCNQIVGDTQSSSNAYKTLEEFMLKYFSKYEILAKWSTQDCMSNDRIPFIGPISNFNKNIYVATGYSKWGITNSAAAAIIISNMILNNNSQFYYDNLFSPYRHLNVNITTVRKISKASINTLKTFTKRFVLNSNDIKDLKNGSAMIICSKGRKIGVYLDYENNYHCIKTVCSHLGCSVAFNNEDKTWECKCHGSRYDIFGKVIEGPATKNLNYTLISKDNLLN